jgi:mannose-6-phosphate isomerase-like protein (cupin superfamily)
VRGVGVYQVELPPGAETVPHDHTADGAEDVYAVIEGAGAVVIDGAAFRSHRATSSP